MDKRDIIVTDGWIFKVGWMDGWQKKNGWLQKPSSKNLKQKRKISTKRNQKTLKVRYYNNLSFIKLDIIKQWGIY